MRTHALARLTVLLLVLGAVAVVEAPVVAADTGPPVRIRLSSTSDGKTVTGSSIGGSASRDGRWAVFTSVAPEYGGSDTHSVAVLADIANRVSNPIAGVAAEADVRSVVISSDGSTIAYTAYVRNRGVQLVISDRNGGRATSPSGRGGEPLWVRSAGLHLSADGRYTLFQDADYADGGSLDTQAAIFDRQTATHQVVSLNDSDEFAGRSVTPSGLSPDGQKAYFYTNAPNLPHPDTEEGFRWRLYMRDVPSRKTTRIMTPGDALDWLNLSANGRYAAVGSPAGISLFDYRTGLLTTVPTPKGVLDQWCQEFSTTVHVSDDARRFVIETCRKDPYDTGMIWSFNRDTGAAVQLAGPRSYIYSTSGDLAGAVYMQQVDDDAGRSVRTDVYYVGAVAASGRPCRSGSVQADAAVLGVRGSGEKKDGASPSPIDYPGGQALAVASVLQKSWGLKLYDDNPRDTDHVIGVAYEASPIAWDVQTIDYLSSRNQGVTSLLAQIDDVRGVCGPRFPLIIVGYSQGADVVQGALQRLAAEAGGHDAAAASVSAVVLFGSPIFSATDPSARGTFVADLPREGGLRGATAVPSLFRSRTRTYCLTKDGVCMGSVTNALHGAHGGYTVVKNKALMLDAAASAASRVLTALPRTAPAGGLTASFDDSGPKPGTAVSAAAVYRTGPPSTSFQWDLDGNGTYDKISTRPWATRLYKRGDPRKVTVHVKVRFQDGFDRVLAMCIDPLIASKRAC